MQRVVVFTFLSFPKKKVNLAVPQSGTAETAKGGSGQVSARGIGFRGLSTEWLSLHRMFFLRSFLGRPRKEPKKPQKGVMGCFLRRKQSFHRRKQCPFPLLKPPTPRLGNRSFDKQRGSCYAFPVGVSTAFICRYTHRDGWYLSQPFAASALEEGNVFLSAY